MKKYIIILSGILFLLSCQETFYPDIQDTDKALVVEGFLCTNPAKSKVIVTYSSDFSKVVYNEPVNNLVIYVTDSIGNRINFTENGTSGIYVTNNDLSDAAVIGNTYTLTIETPDGDVYKSSPQLVVESSTVEKVTINYESSTLLTEDPYGDILEVTYDGAGIYADIKGELPEKNYFLNKWYGYEEHQSNVGQQGQQSTDIFRHVPISSTYTRVLCTVNVDESYGKIIREKKFVFIPDYTYKNYTPPLPSSYLFYRDIFQGYLFVSEQYSLSEDAYIFWNGAQGQLEASGKLFGPVTSQLKSNLSCSTDTEKLVLGVFYASDVKTRYDYLYINSKGRTYSEELDSLPELWIDTCSWSAPSSWIFPHY